MCEVLVGIRNFFLKFDFKNNLRLPTYVGRQKLELIADYNTF